MTTHPLHLKSGLMAHLNRFAFQAGSNGTIETYIKKTRAKMMSTMMMMDGNERST